MNVAPLLHTSSSLNRKGEREKKKKKELQSLFANAFNQVINRNRKGIFVFLKL